MSYPIFHSQYTAAQIEGAIGKSPRINPVTLTWEVWDITSGAYVDTGVAADAQDAATRAEAAASTATDAKDDAVEAKTDAVNAADRAEAAAATLTVDAAISDSSTNPVQNKVIAAALDEKLNVDGYSALATVGNAEQLVSTVRVTDDAPYLFRTAGGAADIGNREYDTLVGGTVAWNQLVDTSDTSVTVTLGHKYLAKKSDVWSMGTSDGTAITVDGSANDMVFDLTRDFGSTIADHAYELETDEAGSGIAWLKRYGFFTKPYYAYNAGALASVAATAHEMVGFNQWDEEWEGGTIESDGTPSSGTSSVTIRSKNFCRCVPGEDYCFTKPGNTYAQIFWYDANQGFIKRNYFSSSASYVFTSPANAAYFKITVGNLEAPISTYGNNVCINLSWSGYRNGEYRPFVKHTYPLDALILRGRLVLDAGGGLYYDGDTYESDGTVERKYGELDLSTLTWTYLADAGNGESYFLSDVRGVMMAPASNDDVAAIRPSSGLTPISGATMYDSYPDRTIAIQSMDGTSAEGHLWIRWPSLSDPADLVTALTGISLVYELAEPTTESADPYQSPQIVEDFGTERYVVTAQLTDFEMPVGHVTEYPANLRDKLQHLPDLANTDGAYAIQQSGTQMTLTPLLLPTGLPTAPSEDGNYRLKCTVADGEVSYSWEVEA